VDDKDDDDETPPFTGIGREAEPETTADGAEACTAETEAEDS
jgi:hypothetical protein